MIISILKINGETRVKSDDKLTDFELQFLTDFGHLLQPAWEYTLLDFVKIVHSNYKGRKTDALINKVMWEYNGNKPYIK